MHRLIIHQVANMLKQLFLSTFRYYAGSLKLLKITLHKLSGNYSNISEH